MTLLCVGGTLAFVLSPVYLLFVLGLEVLYLAAACMHPGFQGQVAFTQVMRDYVSRRNEYVARLAPGNRHRFGVFDALCQQIVERDAQGASGRARFQLLLDLSVAFLELLICQQQSSEQGGRIAHELTRIEESVQGIAQEVTAASYDDTLKERINSTLWTLEETRKLSSSELGRGED